MNNKSIEDRNFYYLVQDIVWFGIAWVSINRFLSVYAIRVGATPTELGWITAGPPIGMALASIFSVWWRNRYPDSIKAIALPTMLFRFSFLLLALTPMFPPVWQPIWIIVSVTLPSLPQGLSNVIFLGLLKETMPDSRMTRLLGRRTLTVNISLGVSALVFGTMLERVPYPTNYMLMFCFAFVAAMISQWHLMHVRPLDPEAVKPRPQKTHANPWHSPAFRQVIMVAALSQIAFFSVFPILALRLVNELNANEGYMAVFSVFELAAGAGLAVFLARIINRIGNRRMIGAAMILTAISAVIAAMAPSLEFALFAAVFAGAGWSTAEIGMVGYFTENVPVKDSAYYTRMYAQSIWAAMFVGPFIGTWLAEMGISLAVILVIGAVLRVLAGLYALQLFPLSQTSNAPQSLPVGTGD